MGLANLKVMLALLEGTDYHLEVFLGAYVWKGRS